MLPLLIGKHHVFGHLSDPYWVDAGFENASVIEVGDESTGEIWFRVRLGRFANEQDADKAVTLLMDDHSTEGWVYHLEDAATIDW